MQNEQKSLTQYNSLLGAATWLDRELAMAQSLQTDFYPPERIKVSTNIFSNAARNYFMVPGNEVAGFLYTFLQNTKKHLDDMQRTHQVDKKHQTKNDQKLMANCVNLFLEEIKNAQKELAKHIADTPEYTAISHAITAAQKYFYYNQWLLIEEHDQKAGLFGKKYGPYLRAHIKELKLLFPPEIMQSANFDLSCK
ncbi:MAG: hypothetical protein AB7F64_06355 [Gammaproteobacteria bacterium]